MTIQEQIKDVLAGHLAEDTTGHYRNGGKWKVRCSCGHVSKYKGDPDFDDKAHAAHQAAMLAPVVAEAQAVALTAFADEVRTTEPLFMDDGRAITVNDLLRERAAAIREGAA